jgi:hypothetical protein
MGLVEELLLGDGAAGGPAGARAPPLWQSTRAKDVPRPNGLSAGSPDPSVLAGLPDDLQRAFALRALRLVRRRAVRAASPRQAPARWRPCLGRAGG